MLPPEEHLQNAPPDTDRFELALKYLSDLLLSPKPPEMPADLSGRPDLKELGETILAVRRSLAAFAEGDFLSPIKARGSTVGQLKALQSRLQHLAWQALMVARGDFTQRNNFMGELGNAFNMMVEQLDHSLRELSQKELMLSELNLNLQKELKRRAAIEADLRRVQRRYKLLASLDPLTKVYNRRQFLLHGCELLKLVRRSGQDAYLAMLDLDHFKKVNDTYGHAVGDQALRHIARCLQKNLRDTDVLCRYGGEEFAVLLTDMRHDGCLKLLKRLHAYLAQNPMRHDGKDLRITISLGAAKITPRQGESTGKTMMAGLKTADQYLYAAKQAGRDCSCLDGLIIPN